MAGEGNRKPALLLIGCSKRKASGLERGRAWDLYDGRAFQVLKKALRDRDDWMAEVVVLIASARYGVVTADAIIETYDERLAVRPPGLDHGRFSKQLDAALAGRSFRSVRVDLGRAYRSALPGLDSLFTPLVIDWASGGIGSRNAATRRWVLDRLAEAEVAFSGGTR